MATNTLALTIGAQSDGSVTFQGVIDEANVYNVALNASEVADLVNSGSPAAPVLISPTNSAIGVAVNPALSWNLSAGATSYEVQVSAANDFSNTIFDQNSITGTSISVTGLSNSS